MKHAGYTLIAIGLAMFAFSIMQSSDAGTKCPASIMRMVQQ